jgi:3-oxoacyl-[acyl-carrier-protein] synthase II
MNRVVVTGLGIVSPLGLGIADFWAGVLSERTATRNVTRFPTVDYSSRVAAEIDGFDPANYMDGKRVRWTDRFSQFAVAATRLALDDAAFAVAPHGEDVGVYLGSALGGLGYAEEQHDVFRDRGLGAVRPLLAISVFGGAATCNVAMEFGFSGPTVANGNSCASGAVAIGDAFHAIQRGDIRTAVAGGVEAPLSPLVFGAFSIIRAMSTRNDDAATACRPFDPTRDGFVMAEGAGVLVLERYDDAVKRGARIYAEITGYGLSNDAYHMSAPRPDGSVAARAIRNALRGAALGADEIELFNAHGSGTMLGDKGEAAAMAAAFGERAATVPVTATKGQHGHALGATGAWEAALACCAIAYETVPRSVNGNDDDPECRVALVRERLNHGVRTVLSNSAGFGGLNAALVFREAS